MDGEVFEILATFLDFVQFKSMFLDYKKVKSTWWLLHVNLQFLNLFQMKEGRFADFSKDFSITKYSM